MEWFVKKKKENSFHIIVKDTKYTNPAKQNNIGCKKKKGLEETHNRWRWYYFLLHNSNIRTELTLR